MCAIVGVINSKDAAKTVYYALFAMQHRGQEASGISACDEGHIETVKGRGLVTEVFDKKSFEVLKGDMAIGHNRYATAGKNSAADAQPRRSPEPRRIRRGSRRRRFSLENGSVFLENPSSFF